MTTRPRVLLVDDDTRILAGLRRQLHRQYEVSTAPGGEQGLATLHADGPFAVVISDMRMPGMDGATFLAHVRAASPRTTRMLLTGQTELSTAIRAINDGQVFRFLDKPCQPTVLERALREAVARYETACDEHGLPADVIADRRVMAVDAPADSPVRLGGHEFRVHYQPILEFAQERVTAVEAMLYGYDTGAQAASAPWPVPPEQTDGSTLPLRRWMTAAACQEVASWPTITAGGPMRVHVKTSARQLRDPLAGDDLARTLVLSGLEPGRVVLEIRDAATASEDGPRRFLQTVTGSGVRLALVCPDADPVALHVADTFPISAVKLAGSGPLDHPPFLEAVRARGLTLIAAGVTSAEDDQRARKAGYDAGQGPAYGDPTDPSDLLANLADLRLA
jgi:EAL domain-containing protein (putative c-di-GMP-specific phosphodiesterase class I)